VDRREAGGRKIEAGNFFFQEILLVNGRKIFFSEGLFLGLTFFFFFLIFRLPEKVNKLPGKQNRQEGTALELR